MRSTSTRGKVFTLNLLNAVAWLAVVVLGLNAIYSLTEIMSTMYLLSGGENAYELGWIRYAVVFVGAIAWLFGVIYSGEYSLKHPGERGTWKRLGWILAIEAVISVIAFLLS